MQMSKLVLYLATMNRFILYTVILGTCFFVSHIAINGTNQFLGKDMVKNISYKLPDHWEASSSDKQFRLLEVNLDTNEDFSLVVFNNIQGTADQNIDRWIGLVNLRKMHHWIALISLLQEIAWIINMLHQLRCMAPMRYLEWGTIQPQ